jgi:putative Holliday junction resolvase
MGLDFGAKTVGVAISDPLMMTAQGLTTIRRERESKQRQTLAQIEEIVREYGVEKIVLGMPYNMDGTLGERAEKTLAFKERLERRSGLPVVLWDERLTTYEAGQTMSEAGISAKKRKDYVDMMAAVLILREFMQHEEENH